MTSNSNPKPKPCTPKPVMAFQYPNIIGALGLFFLTCQYLQNQPPLLRLPTPSNFRPEYECLDFSGVTEGTGDGEVHQSFPHIALDKQRNVMLQGRPKGPRLPPARRFFQVTVQRAVINSAVWNEKNVHCATEKQKITWNIISDDPCWALTATHMREIAECFAKNERSETILHRTWFRKHKKEHLQKVVSVPRS